MTAGFENAASGLGKLQSLLLQQSYQLIKLSLITTPSMLWDFEVLDDS